MEQNSKRVFIKTYGCQMNVYDSERIRDVLKPLGYETADTPESADLVVLNTCHIREKAAEKVYSEIGRLRGLKEKKAAQGRPMTLVAAGCVAQAEGLEMRQRSPLIDFVVGPQSYQRLPDMLARASEKPLPSQERFEADFAVSEKFDRLKGLRRTPGAATFLSVQEGCDKFCSFCVVPYTRGAEVSRPVQDIVEEARALVREGTRELTLLGQNVNAYHGEAPPGAEKTKWGLGLLIEHLARLEGLERLRFTTSHPVDMAEDLIEAFAREPKLMPYLHLPLQSGSDSVLKAMNRRHTFKEYARIIERVRKARPDIAISGDFIVGFPGETEEDFEATLQAVREINYAQAFSFKYSQRPGTPGAERHDQIPEAIKTERLERLQNLLKQQQTDFNQRQKDCVLPVLFEQKGRKPGQLRGRSPYLQSVHVEAPSDFMGKIAMVKIQTASPHGLSGVLHTRKTEAA